MKFLVLFAAVCIGAAFAEVALEEQVLHELELTELCKERGVFANPHDPEGRTFIRCELEPVELQCDEEFIFDAEKLMCVEKPQPPAPEPTDFDKVNWQEVLTCPEGVEDKYYRNPYDCSRFYRCYKQGEFNRLDANKCLPTMIFDEALETCLPAEQYRSYYGVECVNARLPVKEVEPEHKPEEQEHKPEEQEHKPEEQEHKPEEQEVDPDIEPVPEHQPEEQEHKPEEQEHQPEEQEHKPEEQEHQPEAPVDPEVEPVPEHQPEEQEHQPEEQEHKPEEQEHLPEEQEHLPEEQEHLPEEQEHQPEEQETEPEVVPEQKEKVPSLNEILKQIKDMFGKNL